MNTFAGNFTLKQGSIDTEKAEFDIVASGENTYFCMGQIDVETSEELKKYLEEQFWEFMYYDLSISTEDEVEICSEWYQDGVYELVSFESDSIDFEVIAERFQDVDEVCVIREAEVSKKYGNRIIKVDFLY